MGKDSDLGYHPQESEAGLKPKWIVLHKEIFPEGSIGRDLFPEILKGRRRPETIFNQPTSSLWQKGKKTYQQLESCEIKTVGQILSSAKDEFSSIPGLKTKEVKERLKKHLEGLAISPHAEFLNHVFGSGFQTIVPPEREQELIDDVDKILDQQFNLSESLVERRKYRVLQLCYGLEDGITRTLTGTAKVVNREYPDSHSSGENIRIIESKALRQIRYPRIGKIIKGYEVLPETNLGRQVFDAVYNKDLADLKGLIGDLFLSDSAKLELKCYGFYSEDSLSLLLQTNGSFLLPEVREELIAELKEVEQREKDGQSLVENITIFPKHQETQKEPLVNNLLPEINLTEEQILLIADISIDDFALPVRAYNALYRAGIIKVRQVLRLLRSDLPDIRNFGRKAACELGEQLEKLLLSQGLLNHADIESGVNIPDMFMFEFPGRPQEEVQKEPYRESPKWRNRLQEYKENRRLKDESILSQARDIFSSAVVSGLSSKEIQEMLEASGIKFKNLSKEFLAQLITEYLQNKLQEPSKKE